MKNKVNLMKIVIILIPLIAGLLINYSSFIQGIYFRLWWVFILVFILFWFWGGKFFAEYARDKIVAFLLANSLWGISFILFIWQFVIVDGANRNLGFALISQLYMMLLLPLVSRMMSIFSNTMSSTNLISISYIFMIFIFSLGFFYNDLRNKV